MLRIAFNIVLTTVFFAFVLRRLVRHATRLAWTAALGRQSQAWASKARTSFSTWAPWRRNGATRGWRWRTRPTVNKSRRWTGQSQATPICARKASALSRKSSKCCCPRLSTRYCTLSVSPSACLHFIGTPTGIRSPPEKTTASQDSTRSEYLQMRCRFYAKYVIIVWWHWMCFPRVHLLNIVG